MSRHEGVSCDSCLKGNFRGRRYKCLICYDYDLCASCYEASATTSRHTVDHPMQCILTSADIDLYYGGEAFAIDQPQAFTCPFCGKMGFTEHTLQEHVTTAHPDSTTEVVCPICAAQPGGEPNLITEDFSSHLMLEHRNNQRDLISFLDDPPTGSRHIRRIPHPTRGIASSRTRRSNMHFSSTSGISSLSPSANRDNVDPIAELLSQLSGVRRSTAQGSASAQLQQLQMQLQLERQQVRAARQQLERLPRRQTHGASGSGSNPISIAITGSITAPSGSSSSSTTASKGTAQASASGDNTGAGQSNSHNANHPQLILSKLLDATLPESELQVQEIERADRSLFMKEILLAALTDKKEEQLVRKERVSPKPMQVPTSAVATPSSTIKQVEQQISSTKRSQSKPSSTQVQRSQQTPPTSTQPVAQPRTTAPAPPRVVHTGNIGTIREVMVGGNFNPDPTHRKPLCPLDNLNKTSEPPTSH